MSVAAETSAQTPLLACRGISKQFGGVTALDGVDFDLFAGEVHGLVGGNGAGKSTLMKILAGALGGYEGTILLNGRAAELSGPRAALEAGIAMVYQDLSGVAQLSVAENVFLGRQPITRRGRIDWRGMRRASREQLGELDIDVDVTRRLDSFSLATRQMVEIARGFHSGARALILDEPTSALSPAETGRLFALIRRLRDRGVAIAFISHFIEDVLEICDRVTILRDGRRLETSAAADLEKHYVIRTMLGHSLEGVEQGYESAASLGPRTTAAPVFAAEGLGLPGEFANVDIEVSPGECLGIYGFAGAGHQVLMHALAGARRPSHGRILLNERPLKLGSCHDAVSAGVALVAADRAQSLFMRGEVYKNVTLAHLRRTVGNWLTARREIACSREVLDRVGCIPPEPRMLAGGLSGGNQQKAVMAKWLLGPLKVLLLDEPTRGMDVGAKDEVMRLVAELKSRGLVVVLASVEPEMILAHADRILVMSRGRIVREFTDGEVDKPTLMQCG